MITRAIAAALLLVAACPWTATVARAEDVPANPIRGRVVDAKGEGIESAGVTAVEIHRTVVTDASGRFTLPVPAAGTYTLHVGKIGLAPQRVTVVVPATGSAPDVALTLVEAPIPVAEVSVRASSFGQESGRQGTTLRRIDIYTTPGAAADLMHSVHTLPGVHSPNEGAALFVRGGDPSETLVRLDGGDVGHPYHYESASGGLFGIIDPSLIQAAYFSSGAFSPRYGNALSGVLDVQTTPTVERPAMGLGVNIVGGGGTLQMPLVSDRLAGIASIEASSTDLLHRLYGSGRTFVSVPSSGSVALKMLARTSESGRVSVMAGTARDRTGVLLDFPTYDGGFYTSGRVDLLNASWKDVVWGSAAASASLARTWYRNQWNFSDFRYANTEVQWTTRGEVVWPASAGVEVTAGADGSRESSDYRGTVPADSTDYASGAPTRTLVQNAARTRGGVFVDNKVRVVPDVYATLGGRVDRYGIVSLTDGAIASSSTHGAWTVDPRVALAWTPAAHWTLRAAGGGFHQSAPLKYTDAAFGNPDIAPLAAVHWIGGAEYAREGLTARAEAYRKTYEHLVLNDSLVHYSNAGDGEAEGVDLFVERRTGRVRAWVAYGYLVSNRHELQATERVPSPYAPRHDLTMVGTYSFNGSWDLGGKLRWAAGSRYTPIVGATYDAARDVYHPIEGPLYSGIYPDYVRLDVRLSKVFELPPTLGLPSAFGIAYIEGMNVLDIRNVLEYRYDASYSQRHEVESYFSRRMFVLGVALNW